MKARGLVAALGGEGRIVQADETYHVKVETPRSRSKYSPPPTKKGKRSPTGERNRLPD